jgi:hypothetical protein
MFYIAGSYILFNMNQFRTSIIKLDHVRSHQLINMWISGNFLAQMGITVVSIFFIYLALDSI